MVGGAGPDHPWDAATGEWLQAAPGPQTGWTGDVSSLVRTPVPPRIVLHTANVLRATEIRTWGHAAATVRWQPPEDGATQLTVAHFKAGDRYTTTPCPGWATPRALTPHAPHRYRSRAAPGTGRLRRAASGVGSGRGRHPTGPPPQGHRERVPMGRADAPPHRAPRVHAEPPQGHPRPSWDDLIAAFHDHGILPATRGRRSSGRCLARTTGAASAPACWRSGTPSDRGGTTSGSAISTLGRRPPTSRTPADSAESVTRCPPQQRQAPTGASGAPR